MGGVGKLEEKPPKSWVEWASLRKKRRNRGWSGPVRGKTAKIMGGVGKFEEKPTFNICFEWNDGPYM